MKGNAVKKLGLVLVAVVTAVTLFAVAPANGADGSPNRVTLSCFFSLGRQMRKQVDPIVQPGIQVSAHSHDFYGLGPVSDYSFAFPAWPPVPNHETDPGYRPRTTTCRTYGDWADYWFPTPKFNGTFTLSGDMQETWQSPAGSTVQAPPFGMLYIVGNSKAASEAEEGAHLRFTCGDLDGPGAPAPMDCSAVPGGSVTAELTFPNCWDNYALLYDTFQYPAGIPPSHFTYGSPCPAGTKELAQLVTRQHFIDPRTNDVMVNPFNADGSLALSFASGPYYTYHGDFENLWNFGLNIDFVAGCLNHTKACPRVDGL